MNLDNITQLDKQSNDFDAEIKSRIEALGKKLWDLFRNILYYSSDEEVELSEGGRVFKVKYAGDGMSVEIYEIVKEKKRFFRFNEYSDHVLKVCVQDGTTIMHYSEQNIGKIIIVTALAQKYLVKYFTSKIEKKSLTLTAIKELESFMEGEYVNKNL